MFVSDTIVSTRRNLSPKVEALLTRVSAYAKYLEVALWFEERGLTAAVDRLVRGGGTPGSALSLDSDSKRRDRNATAMDTNESESKDQKSAASLSQRFASRRQHKLRCLADVHADWYFPSVFLDGLFAVEGSRYGVRAIKDKSKQDRCSSMRWLPWRALAMMALFLIHHPLCTRMHSIGVVFLFLLGNEAILLLWL